MPFSSPNINIGRFRTFLITLLVVLFCASLPAQQQVGLKLYYPTKSAYNHWGHLASGDTVAIGYYRFSKSPSDPRSYALTSLELYPISNHASRWFVDELRLYRDDGDKIFNRADVLVHSSITIAPLPLQDEGVIPLNIAIDTVQLDATKYLWIVACMHDWRDADPENLEITTGAGGPDQFWFGIDTLGGFTVYPSATANFSHDPQSRFYYQAKNLPVTIRNNFATIAEDDSIRRNMFFPNYQPLNTAGGKQQRLTDLTFFADVHLPLTTTNNEFKLSAAAFDIGFDNTILELDTTGFALGEAWGADPGYWVSDTLVYRSDQPTDPTRSVYHFSGRLQNSLTDTAQWRQINNQPVTRFKFRVIRPGISPIYILNEDLRDNFNIRYHTYRILQNGTNPADRYDGWAKFILGDCIYATAAKARADYQHMGDSQVTWEDITLLAEYIWLGRSHSNWHARFDIGSAGSLDPDQLVSDDTTNFFDLLMLVRNYRRTYQGAFLQKVQADGKSLPLTLELVPEGSENGFDCYAVNIQNASNIAALQIKLTYASCGEEMITVQPSAWLEQMSNRHLFLQAPVGKGQIDLNLLFPDIPLDGKGTLCRIRLQQTHSVAPALKITEVIARDADLRPIELAPFSAELPTTLPHQTLLVSNYPNPFNARTFITLQIGSEADGDYSIRIFDTGGNLVREFPRQKLSSGLYRFWWDGRNDLHAPVASGLYFILITGKKHSQSHKMLLLR